MYNMYYQRKLGSNTSVLRTKKIVRLDIEYWSGCIKAATVICQQIFSFLALVIFLFKSPFKKCFKIVFSSLWRQDPVLELQLPTPLRVVLLCFATQSLQIAL